MPVGTIVLNDITGQPTARITAGVVARGWLALPREICLGGYEWQFFYGNGDPLEITGGIIGEPDAVGIWQLPPENLIKGPPLMPWDAGKPLRWSSIVSDRTLESVVPQNAAGQRYVIEIQFASGGGEAGVFVQDNSVVGWTFEGLEDIGYLWKGLDGEGLVYEISVYDYYRLTFENSREERLLIAYAQPEDQVLDRLRNFADAFLLDTRLPDFKTPPRLRPQSVIPEIKALAGYLVQQGRQVDLADVFDGRRLAAVGDMPLITDVARAAQEVYGFDAAIELIEDVKAAPTISGDDTPVELNAVLEGLYRRWLTTLIRGGDLNAAGQVYDRASTAFPADSNIHLLGVELALESGDWATAEQRLNTQAYPVELADQVKILQNQIAALKSDTGKIVIRFTPGARQIPVSALLSGNIAQKFLVDTGATMVTIPHSTARQMGLADDSSPARRWVHTAGGTIEAPEVIIPSIRLDGHRIDNVPALVIDLPNQPDVGLLGLNYLQLFQVSLNSEAGVLTLAPR